MMTAKFCYNEDCGYVCQVDSDRYVYSPVDEYCPACQPVGSSGAYDELFLKTEIPEFKVKSMIRQWWKNQRDSHYA